jgi:hypothetical protein
LRGIDLALLKVDRPSKGQDEPSFDLTHQLQLSKETMAGDLSRAIRAVGSLMVFGYGYTERDVLGERMGAEIPVFSEACEKRAVWSNCYPFREMILADHPGSQKPRDSCEGDSGGPAVLALTVPPKNSTEKEGKTVNILVGITSRSAPGTHVDQTRHCGGGGIYSVVGRYDVYDWLSRNGVELEWDYTRNYNMRRAITAAARTRMTTAPATSPVASPPRR